MKWCGTLPRQTRKRSFNTEEWPKRVNSGRRQAKATITMATFQPYGSSCREPPCVWRSGSSPYWIPIAGVNCASMGCSLTAFLGRRH